MSDRGDVGREPECNGRAPYGLYCTRPKGHEGACAAREPRFVSDSDAGREPECAQVGAAALVCEVLTVCNATRGAASEARVHAATAITQRVIDAAYARGALDMRTRALEAARRHERPGAAQAICEAIEALDVEVPRAC